MSDIFQIASVGMLEGRQRLQAVSMNAAGASAPGFRRQVVTGRTFDASLRVDQSGSVNGERVAANAAAVADGAAAAQVDLRPGAMLATGRALDLAVDGDDLFFALTDGTQTWLTRAGSFQLNEAGVVVGERGLRLVGTQGDVRLPDSEVTVAADGRFMSHGVAVATLQLFRPDDRAAVLAAQGTLLTAPGLQPAEAGTGRVRSGMLEASNTDSAREMLSLMELSRQFEGLSQIVKGYDELLGRVIEKLGEG